ncbi:hypothetical protein [Novosphingobium sp.]|uniref:hypothetical protein n=1 Tax=Novosphingobium sp. TaxID=1874826 RepID=UPI003529EF08
MPRAVGQQGSWFAVIENANRYPDIDGKRLPCLHQYWWSSPRDYHDKGAAADDDEWKNVSDALAASGYAILTSSDTSSMPWRRIGYIAVFAVENVVLGVDGLRLRFTKRICDLD